jgi:hypothetical protein
VIFAKNAYRAVSSRTKPKKRVFILSGLGTLQDGKLRRSKTIQRCAQPLLLVNLHCVELTTLALLLEKEPANLQAQSLGMLIDKAVTQGLRHCLQFPMNSCQSSSRGLRRLSIGRRRRRTRHTACGWSHTASNPQMMTAYLDADPLPHSFTRLSPLNLIMDNQCQTLFDDASSPFSHA